MKQRFILLAILLVVALPIPIATAQTAERCFPETGKCISGVIRSYWENNGGLAVFGYPITDLATETNADGFTGPTQWFERDRLEDHSAEGAGVLAGRLGAQKLAMEGRPWETLPKATGAVPACLQFPQTGHTLCPPFRAYWERNGGLARFGFPISEPATETNSAGFTGVVQWFERRRMEAHPENQAPYDILLGLLGNEVHGPATPPQPLTFSGRSNQASEPFDLGSGLFIVDGSHTGRSNFIVHLLDMTGDTVEYLINELGTASRTNMFYVPSPARFILEVNADGDWQINIRKATAQDVNGGPRVPTTLTGSGNKTIFVTFGRGLARFRFTHSGRSNFIVHVNDLQNDTFGYVINELGPAEGSSVQNIDAAGPYIVDIAADGAWSIDISQ